MSNDIEIKWQDPSPKTTNTTNKVFLFLDELKKNPMNWALWSEGAHGCRATYFRKNYGWKGIQVVTERVKDAERKTAIYKIFLRYNPETDITNKESK